MHAQHLQTMKGTILVGRLRSEAAWRRIFACVLSKCFSARVRSGAGVQLLGCFSAPGMFRGSSSVVQFFFFSLIFVFLSGCLAQLWRNATATESQQVLGRRRSLLFTLSPSGSVHSWSLKKAPASKMSSSESTCFFLELGPRYLYNNILWVLVFSLR